MWGSIQCSHQSRVQYNSTSAHQARHHYDPASADRGGCRYNLVSFHCDRGRYNPASSHHHHSDHYGRTNVYESYADGHHNTLMGCNFSNRTLQFWLWPHWEYRLCESPASMAKHRPRVQIHTGWQEDDVGTSLERNVEQSCSHVVTSIKHLRHFVNWGSLTHYGNTVHDAWRINSIPYSACQPLILPKC